MFDLNLNMSKSFNTVTNSEHKIIPRSRTKNSQLLYIVITLSRFEK